jgi:hypothetical protein
MTSFTEETFMISIAEYHHPAGHVAEHQAFGVLGDLCDSCADDDFDDDAAEVRRMIELSGMIGLECGLLGGE